MSKRLTVAIIGGGPAGLTTAKSMLSVGITPTVFDSKPVVGGLWANASSRPTSMTVERRMRTNLSKYTCSFSDFAYGEEVPDEARSSVGMGLKLKIGNNDKREKVKEKHWDMFPAAEEVGRYLEGYAKKFLAGKGCEMRLNTEVTRVEKVEAEDTSVMANGANDDSLKRPSGWRVYYRDVASAVPPVDEVEEFDYLVLASGFNSRAYIPTLESSPSFSGDILHTSQYSWHRILESRTRKLSQTGVDNASKPGKFKIVIIGGSLSGAETSAEIAIEISSLPEEEREKFELVHVFPRPFWVLPRYLPVPQASAPSSLDDIEKELHPSHFLPLDLLLYDLRRRTNAPPPKTTAERYRLANEFIKSLIDSDQSDYSPNDSDNGDLTISGEAMEAPPWVAVSDSYQGLVKAGKIKTMRGRVTALGPHAVSGKRTCGEGGEFTIEDVDCVIMATGYTPATALKQMLPKDIAASIIGVSESPSHEKEQDFTFLPILLYNHCLHPSLSREGGFVGMYKGPYFAGLELQGRWLAELFAGRVEWPSNEEMDKWIEGERLQREERFKVEGLARSHRSRGEYVDMVLDLCKRLGIPQPQPSMNEEVISPSLNISPVLPAHLLGSVVDRRKSLTNFVREIAQPACFIPIAVFRALQGKWSVSRIIASSTPGPMDGTFFGTAQYIPRKATFVPGELEKNKVCGVPNGTGKLVHIPPEEQHSESATVYEYLYHEDGELTTNAGKVLSARRSYIYRLVLSPTQRILTYFVKRDRTTADYFFHELEFYEEVDEDGEGAGSLWKAKGEHLCSADWYWPEYMFHFGGVELLDFEIGYKVKGPKKDYTTTATYWR